MASIDLPFHDTASVVHTPNNPTRPVVKSAVSQSDPPTDHAKPLPAKTTWGKAKAERIASKQQRVAEFQSFRNDISAKITAQDEAIKLQYEAQETQATKIDQILLALNILVSGAGNDGMTPADKESTTSDKSPAASQQHHGKPLALLLHLLNLSLCPFCRRYTQ